MSRTVSGAVVAGNSATSEKFSRKTGAKSRDEGCHFVYIVKCSDGTLYTGYTTDPERRLSEHNQGKASRYTRARRPVELVHLEKLLDRSSALRRELEIKKMKKEEKLLLCSEKLSSR